MRNTRIRLLIAFLAGSIAIWLLVVAMEQLLYPEVVNYSLIEENLYMGGFVNEPPPGTKAVLNLNEQQDGFVCDIVRWKPISDRPPAPSIAWLRDVVEFVDENQKAGRMTYVHCMNGASRSGMVLVAYVMYRKQWTRDQALAYVRAKRPETQPNPAFMQRLLEWERVVLTENVVGLAR